MKQRLAALLFFVFLALSSAAWADPPISVTHTMTDFSTGLDTVVVSYSLTVKNSGTSTLSNLVLSLDPVPLMSRDRTVLNVASLAPQQQMQLPVTVTSSMVLEQSDFRQLHLFWDYEGEIAENGPVKDLAVSVEGGAL